MATPRTGHGVLPQPCFPLEQSMTTSDAEVAVEGRFEQVKGLTSEELVTEYAATRNELLFDELHRRHYEQVLRFLNARYCPNREDAEDVCQTVFLRVYERPSMYEPRPGKKVEAWLYRIAQNQALNFHEQRTAQKRHEEGKTMVRLDRREFDPSSGDRLITDEPIDSRERSPHACLLRDETSSMLRRVVATQLTEKTRSAIEMHYFEGLSFAEAAGQLGIPVTTFGDRVSRGLEMLRRCLTGTARDVAASPQGVHAA